MHQHIYLEPSERTEIEQLVESGNQSAQVTARALTLLLLDRSQGSERSFIEVSEAAHVSSGTVRVVKLRYFAYGIPGVLTQRSRPGQPVFKIE